MSTPNKVEVIPFNECLRRNIDELLKKNNILIPSGNGQVTDQLQLANRLTSSTTEVWLNRFITRDPLMMDLKSKVYKLAFVKDPVLIIGPTGTGKELIAHALHGSNHGDFLPLNCAAFNENLIESDLFGHVKGSFTGADKDHLGALRSSDNGTVYLDELDKMPPSIQAKLLRAIQEYEVRPVGSSRYYPISCRFVCSSKVDLAILTSQGKFLEDLYARVSTFELHTTSLITRPDDVPLILESLEIDINKYYPLPPQWQEKVDRFNVRALQSYKRTIEVLGL